MFVSEVLGAGASEAPHLPTSSPALHAWEAILDLLAAAAGAAVRREEETAMADRPTMRIAVGSHHVHERGLAVQQLQ
jgi:hypothetical protein